MVSKASSAPVPDSEPSNAPHSPEAKVIPRTLQEGAATASDLVRAEKGKFNHTLQSALESNGSVQDLERRVEEAVRAGEMYLDAGVKVMREAKLLKDDDLVEIEKKLIDRRDQSLYSEDYPALRAFHNALEEALAAADDSGEVTAAKLQNVMESVYEQTIGNEPLAAKYVPMDAIKKVLGEKFPDGNALLDFLDKMKMDVTNKIMSDPDVSDDQKKGIQSVVRSYFDGIASMKMAYDKVIRVPFSKGAISGVIGKVLPNEDAIKVFDGDFSPVVALPAGNVKMVIGGISHEFYHEEGKDDIPVAVKEKGTGPLARKVVHVHYRSDEDMKKVFEDLSDGDCLECMLEGQAIRVEGTDTPVAILKIKPDGLTEEEFFKTPNKFLSHNFTVAGSRI